MSGTYEEAATFEHQFWLQILGDHSRFILSALSPTENLTIEQVINFVELFDHLLEKARRPTDITGLTLLSIEVDRAVLQLRDFKLDLLRRHLVGEISIQISETFFNHMVNELDEYKQILTYLIQEQIPPICHPLHHHLLWISDAAAHSDIIDSNLDSTEFSLKHRSHDFSQHFQQFYLKSIELAGYLRTNLTQFPALTRLNQNISLEIVIFRKFLEELEELGITKQLLGTFTPLMADHMAREECYYILKLAESSHEVEPLVCNPTKPRVTERPS